MPLRSTWRKTAVPASLISWPPVLIRTSPGWRPSTVGRLTGGASQNQNLPKEILKCARSRSGPSNSPCSKVNRLEGPMLTMPCAAPIASSAPDFLPVATSIPSCTGSLTRISVSLCP